MGVLEYYQDPRPQLTELARLVRGGGSVVVSVPNGSNRTMQLDRAVAALAKSVVGQFIKRLTRWIPRRELPGSTLATGKTVVHHAKTESEMRQFGIQAGLRLVDSGHVGCRILPDVSWRARRANEWISRRIGDRPGWKWLARISATMLIVRYEKF